MQVKKFLYGLDPGLNSFLRTRLETSLIHTEDIGQEKIEEQVEAHQQICYEVETAPKVHVVSWQHNVREIGSGQQD